MELNFEGRTALVTGASQGIGRATARMLAMAGVNVVAVARRVALVEDVAKDVAGHGRGKIIPLKADFYDQDAPERVAAEATRLLGHVDILMNAAGQSRPVPFDAGRDQWEEGMVLNFFRIRSSRTPSCRGCASRVGAASSRSPARPSRACSTLRLPPRPRCMCGPRGCRASLRRTG